MSYRLNISPFIFCLCRAVKIGNNYFLFVVVKCELPVSSCSCCGRISFYNDLVDVPKFMGTLLLTEFFFKTIGAGPYPTVFLSAVFCKRCIHQIRKAQIPKVSVRNGFVSCLVPLEIKQLNPIEQRAVSPLLPSLQIIRDKCVTQVKTRGDMQIVEMDVSDCSNIILEAVHSMQQDRPLNPERHINSVIDIAVDPGETVPYSLPRNFNSLGVIPLQFVDIRSKNRSGPFLAGRLSKVKVFRALEILQNSPLYQQFELPVVDTYSNPSNVEQFVRISQIAEHFMPSELQQYSAVITISPPCSTDLRHVYSSETVVHTTPCSQLQPFRQFFQDPIPTVMFDSFLSVASFRDRREDRYSSELMFPTCFAGQKRCTTIDTATIKDIFQNELERSDFQHQVIVKIFHDYFTYVAHRLIVAKSMLCKQKIGGVPVLSNPYNTFLYEQLLSRVRSSPQFWLSKRRNLNAMIRQIGIPTFFFTYSPAETEWPEMVQALLFSEAKRHGTFPLIQTLDVFESLLQNKTLLNDLLASNPYIAVKMVMRRSNMFQKYLLFPKEGGVLGIVTDYYYRVEFQARGSPHIHMILWVDGAPKYSSATEADNVIVTQFIDQYISTEYSSKDSVDKKKLKTQIHSHSFSCQKHGSCRYRFPIPPSVETVILKPIIRSTLSEEEAALIEVRYTRIQECMTVARCLPISMETFMSSLSMTEAQYRDALRLCYIDRDVILYKRQPSDQMVNKYNPTLLSAWEANLDLTFVLDGYACAAYMVNYITKGYRELSVTLREYIKHLQQDDRPLSPKLLALAAKLVGSSQIGIQEAICQLCSVSLSQSSRWVMYVNTQRPVYRVTVSPETIFDDDDTLDRDDDELADGLLQHYFDRHSDLEEVCFAYYCQYFHFKVART